MKSIFYSFLIGVAVGGVVIFLLLNKSTPVRAKMSITSSDPLAKITNQNITVKTKRTIVEAITSFETDRKGIYTKTIILNRKDLQFNNSLYGEVGYLINSQTALFDLGYSYKEFLISAKLGYSFRLKELDYGFGIGGKLSF